MMNEGINAIVIDRERRIRERWIKEAIWEWDNLESRESVKFADFLRGFVYRRWVVYASMN